MEGELLPICTSSIARLLDLSDEECQAAVDADAENEGHENHKTE